MYFVVYENRHGRHASSPLDSLEQVKAWIANAKRVDALHNQSFMYFITQVIDTE
jgi:hypothetical protein